MKIHIPCPINEKDLCSDVLFDDLFDDNTYCCDGHGVLIGFVHHHVVKMKYIYGSNVVHFEVLDHPLSSDIKSRISQWLEIVRTGVNENSLDANTKLSTIPCTSMTYALAISSSSTTRTKSNRPEKPPSSEAHTNHKNQFELCLETENATRISSVHCSQKSVEPRLQPVRCTTTA